MLINERQTAHSLLVHNMEESQVTKLNEIEKISTISPEKILSSYLIINVFKAHKIYTYLIEQQTFLQVEFSPSF